ncbi:unnamed protein product [Somion occarium]|uniref:F-box domain-containing protein n=1 Tax=Somion occarium TaxID=3059160 RepID=A0ABP1CSV2_9APHY
MSIALADLPAEVLIDILSDACTDSGLTGCSLTSVSRDFRALCLWSGVDIQCAAVYGLERMRKFLVMIERRDRDARRVKHLFLTDRVSVDDGFLPSDSCFDMERLTTDLDKLPACWLNRILHAISPYHLKTLTILMPCALLTTVTAPSIFSIPFPSLSELTLHVSVGPCFFDDFSAISSLKRLHIAAFRELPGDIGSSISKVAPTLTHLRISGVTNPLWYGNLPEVLREYVPEEPSPPSPVISKPPSAFPIPSPLDTSLPGSLPPSLHDVIIGFAPFYQLAVRNFERRKIAYFQTAKELKRIMPPDEPNTTREKRLVVLDPPPVTEEDERDDVLRERYKLIRMEWEERILGDEGCWKVA